MRRVPIDGGVAWFKACAPSQAFEPRLTASLARRWPDRLPEVLAYDDKRVWLLLGDAGEPLGVGGSPEPWLAVLPRYAELQRGDVVRAPSTATTAFRIAESRTSRRSTRRCWRAIDGAARILDWGDSCVSHPFVTVFVTFLHLDELSSGDPWYARLRDAYLEPWGLPTELHATFELAQRVGPFAHAFKELRVLDGIPEVDRPQFAPNLPAVLAGCVAAL